MTRESKNKLLDKIEQKDGGEESSNNAPHATTLFVNSIVRHDVHLSRRRSAVSWPFHRMRKSRPKDLETGRLQEAQLEEVRSMLLEENSADCLDVERPYCQSPLECILFVRLHISLYQTNGHTLFTSRVALRAPVA
jgi:hypothetical protein